MRRGSEQRGAPRQGGAPLDYRFTSCPSLAIDRLAQREYDSLMRTLPLLVLVVAVSPATGCVASTRMAVWPAGAKPAGPYSPAVLVDGTLYVAGQLGRDPKTGDYPSDFQAEVRQCLERVGLVLGAAGMDFSDVVSAQVFLTDVTQFAQMNAVYETFFIRPPLPARTTVGVSALPGGKARIEVSVIARK